MPDYSGNNHLNAYANRASTTQEGRHWTKPAPVRVSPPGRLRKALRAIVRLVTILF